MLTELDGRVASAQQEYDRAVERARELTEAAHRARQEAATIGAHGEKLLAAVAKGEGEVTHEQLLESAGKAREASAKADIAEAVGAAAQRQREQAQIELFRAQAAALSAEYQRAVDRELAIADEIDEVAAHLGDLIASYHAQTQATHVAFQACHRHNGHELSAQHNHNATLASLSHYQWPRASVPQHPGSLPGIKFEMFTNIAAGSVNARRAVINSLSPRLRQSHARPIKADEAA